MAKYAMYIDCFSAGLDDMKRKEQGDPRAVLQKLSTMKRFSVFEACDNDTIAHTMTLLFKQGYVRDTKKGSYPWTYFEITEAGKAFIAHENSATKTK